MTTREKVLELIQSMSEAELVAEYAHLRQTTGRPAVGDGFEEALDALAGIGQRVSVTTDAVQLVRDERDWLAGRMS
jgi:molybdenum cofactor biosynthesis enzyme MoaA